MAIQITNNSGVLEIIGNITKENSTSLQLHFEQVLTKADKIIISMDKVIKIDSFGVQVLSNLYKKAAKLDKVFFLIGKGNRKVQNAFGKVNYIFRNDFV